jgi:hypothetical protein
MQPQARRRGRGRASSRDRLELAPMVTGSALRARGLVLANAGEGLRAALADIRYETLAVLAAEPSYPEGMNELRDLAERIDSIARAALARPEDGKP